MSEVPSVKRLITLGSQGIIDVWDLSNIAAVSILHTFKLEPSQGQIFFKVIGLVEENTVLIKTALFGKNF